MKGHTGFNYKHGQICEIQTALLHPNPNQPRKSQLDAASIEKLKKSILNLGLIHPITFTVDTSGRLITISGGRRLLACREAGKETIQAKYVDRDMHKIALAENFQRLDLVPMDKAELYLQMKTLDSLTLSQMSEETGEAISSISELLSLNRLPEEIKAECRKNRDFVLSRLVAIAKSGNDKTMKRLFNVYCQELDGKNNKRTSRRGPRGINGLIARISGTITQIKKVDINQTTKDEICSLFLKLHELEQVIQQIAGSYEALSISVFRNNEKTP